MNALRLRVAAVALLGATTLGCPTPRSTTSTNPPTEPPKGAPPGTRPEVPGGPRPEPPAPGAPPGPPPAAPGERVLLLREGREEQTDARSAEAAGYTIVDLRDEWTPLIFRDWSDPGGDSGAVHPHRYRRIFIGLANDQLDDDGQPLPAGEKNYLEVYGIPPSLSVVAARFREDAARTCEKDLDLPLLAASKGVRYVPSERQAQAQARLARLRRELSARQRALGVSDLAAVAAAEPRRAADVEELQRADGEQAALAMAERRLDCEGIKPVGRHRPGVYDDALQEAVRRFQQKHMIYEAAYLRPKTMAALGRPLLENDYATLRRVITERVISAAGILEDGSTEGKDGPQKVRGVDGQLRPLRNLAEEFTQAALKELGLESAAAAQAFFSRHPPEDLRTLRVALKLPPRPDYYSAHMDLSVVVDRGDVWYDLPFDEKGKELSQPRQVYPRFLLYLRQGGPNGEKVPLISWRTTIGGWRSEQAADGYEYYRYKGSDVGPRVIRTVSSGPVWIAPPSTPIRTLVKRRSVQGMTIPVVNYDELGPGFRSAYGLVAGYFVVPGDNGKSDFDNGIRAHGSAEYLSIGAGGFSHGCHRLLNHLAVRLYSFILSHRKMQVKGDLPLGYARQFLYKDEVFDLRLPSRGYHFILDPPLPVNVLEGRIKGERKKPFDDYVPKPGVVYPGPPPPLPGKGGEDRAGGCCDSKEAQ